MHLILHILKKDVRRLWWAVAPTLLLLAALTRTDRWRADSLASNTEGWLNLLVPLAWACLIALVIHEEPLVGVRHFWLTWPYRWPALLAAKTLFVILFIHVPSFLSEAAILALRGFPPFGYLPQLLYKQALLAFVLTIPAMALAALCKNIAHFLLAAIVMVAGAAYLAEMAAPPYVRWLASDRLRCAFSIFVLVAAAIVIIAMQYARRQTNILRKAGIAAVLAAALLFALLPPTFSARMQAALQPTHADISMRLSLKHREPPPQLAASNNDSTAVQVAFPIEASGVPANSAAQFAQPLIEVTGRGGEHYRSAVPSPYNNFEKIELAAYMFPYRDTMPAWLILRIRLSAYESLQAAKVQIKGTSIVTFHRAGRPVVLTVGESRAVPGAGRCSSTLVEASSLYEQSMLKVLCESPDELSRLTMVRVGPQDRAGDWTHGLGDSSTIASGPRQAWLSPLERSQTFFHLTSESRASTPGVRWLVPRDAVRNGQLTITPDTVTAWAVVDFEMRDVSLRDYLLKPAR